VRQLLAVHSGAVALVANSTPAGRDIGNVVFVPASGGALRLLAHANEIAVAPDGEHVWVQQSGTPLGRGPKDNPTWFIDLAGRTLSPVLRLPGALLVAATSQGALTQTENGLHIVTPTGQVTPLPLPADVLFVEAAGDRVVYVSQDCSAQCAAYVLDLRTRRTVAVGLPPRQAFAGVPQPNGFDPTGRRLVLTLIGLNSAGRPIDEDLFVLDMVTKTVSHVPGALVPRPAGLLVTGSWDSTGRLWVLATDILESQLAYWPGSGPLRTLPVIPGGAASVTVLDAAPR
jgi:hypothetical protein